MKKMSLKLDDLAVDSFPTADDAGGRGTVQGHMPPPTLWTCPDAGCEPETANGCGSGTNPAPTAYQTCQQTCWDGCYLSVGGAPGQFTCDPGCFSYYTDCHRCR